MWGKGGRNGMWEETGKREREKKMKREKKKIGS